MEQMEITFVNVCCYCLTVSSFIYLGAVPHVLNVINQDKGAAPSFNPSASVNVLKQLQQVVPHGYCSVQGSFIWNSKSLNQSHETLERLKMSCGRFT